LNKEYRIKKNNDIQSLMQKKQSVGDGYFVIYYHKNHDQNHFRYALSVPKKYGNAVERNLMKRRMREIIKQANIDLPVDIFVIAKVKSKQLDFNGIRDHIFNLLKKSKILKDGNYEK